MASLLIVGLTATIMLLSKPPRRGLRIGTHSGCAGCAGSVPRPKAAIVFRARKGQRPRIIYRAG
jgi:hypothetical protein